MNINIEKEYKILVSKTAFETLLACYPQAIFKEQTNTYYDTSSMAICNAHGAMRIRKTDKFLFTLKMHSEKGLLEYEMPVSENSSAVFQQKEIKKLLDSYQLYGPFIQLTTLCTKRAKIVSEDAELCFDINEYNGICDYEIEYEYLRPHNGRQLFNDILSIVHLQYESNCDAKIKRALDALK